MVRGSVPTVRAVSLRSGTQCGDKSESCCSLGIGRQDGTEIVSGCLKVFYGFGAAGLLWSTWWESVVSAMAEEDPEAHRLLTETAATREASRAEPEQAMPWRAFLRNGPMRALAYTHFCNNWCASGVAASSIVTFHLGVRFMLHVAYADGSAQSPTGYSCESL